MLDESQSQGSVSIDGQVDSFEMVTKAVDSGKKTYLDEAKVKLRIEELQTQMVELANARVGRGSSGRRSELPAGCPSYYLNQQ